MSNIKFKVAAKTDVGLVRQNNEDNFQVSADLSVAPMRWVNNETCSLGDKGMLLVVADGMGGMNAGEVASEIAIDVVREAFSPENLTDKVMADRYSIERFMNSVIVDADRLIKEEAKNNPQTRGMGTTIVIGWVLDGILYLSWCGDSRAYVYNSQAGLHQISKDHSYVQSLVDKGAISKEDAFDFPDSNIITRCLSDSSQKAKPESLLQPYKVCDGDIIMLCTDGLSGMIRDHEIEDILRANEHDMDVCTDKLIRAACDAEGSDNITLCVCQILSGAGVCDPSVFDAYDRRCQGLARTDEENSANSGAATAEPRERRRKLWIGAAGLLVLILAVGASVKTFFPGLKKDATATQSDSIVRTDTLSILYTLDGSRLTVASKDGSLCIGMRAWPNGEYRLHGDTTVVVADSVIKSMETERTVATSIVDDAGNALEEVETEKLMEIVTGSGKSSDKVGKNTSADNDIKTTPKQGPKQAGEGAATDSNTKPEDDKLTEVEETGEEY